jgi:hypothetical protein
LADVVRSELTVAVAVVSKRHAIAANPADDKPLEKRWSFTRRALATVIATRLCTLKKSALVSFVLLPRNVAGVRIAMERKPFFAWKLSFPKATVRLLVPASLPKSEGASVARIVQHLQGSRISQWAPEQIAFVRAAAKATRKQQ